VGSRHAGEVWNYENGLHFTIFFHTFVFLQLFNEINSRKILEGEFNIFANFFDNYLFIMILAFTVVVQILLVQYGGEAVKCSPLTVQQHLMCIFIGFFSLVVGFFVKLIPLSWFHWLKLNEEPLKTQEERSMVASRSLRKSRSIFRHSGSILNSRSTSQTFNPQPQMPNRGRLTHQKTL
jgi:hypothetical protein